MEELLARFDECQSNGAKKMLLRSLSLEQKESLYDFLEQKIVEARTEELVDISKIRKFSNLQGLLIEAGLNQNPPFPFE
jgi:hypothetical protein